MTFGRLFAIAIAIQLLFPSQLWAQTVNATTTGTVHHHVPTPINLNLSSTSATTTAGRLVHGSPVDINVAGQLMQVTHSTLLTPAEKIALYQVISTGQQSLQLGTLGNAVGGSFSIGPKFSQFISSLVIPQGVTAIDHIGNSGVLNLSGNLTNAGTLYITSTNPSISTAVVDALNISNLQGGLLSTVLPAAGLTGVTGTLSNLSLSLNATNSITNAGTITSSGNLSLTAGNSITNALPSGATGNAPLLQAASNINLNSNQIVNSGLINALNGNINIAGTTTGSIAINNTGGTLQAALGNINVRDASFDADSDFTLTGGNLVSQQLNVFSGSGDTTVDADSITGAINITAGEAHVQVNSGTLDLGTLNLSGDPTFYNTTGSITLSSDLDFSGQNLALVASGDITTSTAGLTIDTSSSTGNAGAITLIAGAKFTSTGPSSVLPPGTGDTTSTLTITGGSTTGGKIDLGTNAISSFNANSTAGSGGNVTLVAFAGSETGSGAILLPTNVNINTAGAAGTTNGNVTIIGGGALTSQGVAYAVNLGGINASGAGSGGNIMIAGAIPTVISPVTILNGAITGGSFGTGAPVAGEVYIGAAATSTTPSYNITTDGNVTISTGGNIVTNGTVTANNGNITVTTTANNGNILVGGNMVAGGTLTLNANGSGQVLGLNQSIATITSNDPNLPNGFQFLLGAAATPNGQFLYVPDYQLGIVAVISTATNQQVATINLPSGTSSQPEGIVVSPDGSTVYVAELGVHGVAIISTASNTVTNTIPITSGNPEAVATSPNGQTLYVLSDNGTLSTAGQAYLSVVTNLSSANPTIVTTLSLGTAIQQTGGIAVNPTGTLAYVSNSGSQNVYVINLTTNQVQSTISLSSLGPQSPFFLAMNPSGTQVYVAESYLNRSTGQILGSIAVIDSLPISSMFDQVIANIALPQESKPDGAGSFPQALSVNSTGTELFVQSTYYNGMSDVSTALNQYLYFISTGQGPDGFGSSSFSTVVTNNGISNITTYTSNTLNLTPLTSTQLTTFPVEANTISVVQAPTIQAHNISLTSGSGYIVMNYDALGGQITANSKGNVILNNLGSVPSSIGTSSGSTFQVGSLNSITTTGAISSSNISLMVTQNNGSITLGGNIGSSTTDSVSLSTNGTGSISQTAGTIFGQSLTLTSTGGNLGTSTNALSTSAAAITAGTTGSGTVYLSNAGATTVAGGGSDTVYSLSASGTITTKANIIAPTISLATTASNGSIVIGTTLGQAGEDISLSANGSSGSITENTGTYQIVADTLTIVGGSGGIGSSSMPLRTAVGQLSVLTSGLNVGGSAYLTNTGTLTLAGDFTAGGAFSLTNSGNLNVNYSGAGSQPGTLTLQTTNSGNIDIASNVGYLTSSVNLTGSTTTINASGAITNSTGSSAQVEGLSVTLKSGTGPIGAPGNQSINVSALNLSVTSAGNAYINGSGSETGGVILGKSSAVGTFQLTESGSIIQSAAGTIITAQNIILQATGSGNSIGTSSTVLGLSSGTSSALNLQVQDAGSAYLSVAATGTGSGGVILNGANNSTGTGTGGGIFKLTAAGPITIGTGSTVSAAASLTLAATAANASITQTDTTGTTTLFAPSVTLTAGSGSGSIGLGNPILFAATSNDSQLSVNLTASASGSVYVTGMNSLHPTDAISVYLVGASSAGAGATTFSLNASGSIQVVNTTTGAGKVTDTTGTIVLTAGTGGSITQTQAGTTLTAAIITLTADSAGTSGTIGTPAGSSAAIPLGVSTARLSATAGSDIVLSDSVAATSLTANSASGNVTLSDSGTVTLVNPSSANGTFTLTANGLVTFQNGSNITAGTAVNLSSGAAGGFVQQDTNLSDVVITAPAVTLSAGSSGIGKSAALPLGIASQVGTTASPVLLTLNSTGAVYINGNDGTPGTSGFALNTSSSTSTLNLNVQGDILMNGLAMVKAPTFVLTATGSIATSIQNTTAASPLAFTASAGGDVSVQSGSPVNLVGISSTGANASTGFRLSAAGNIAFQTNAQITSSIAVDLSTTGKGNITQTSAGTTITSPSVTLDADTSTPGTTSSVGSLTVPLTVSSGTNQPVTLNVQAASGAYVSSTGAMTLTGQNKVTNTNSPLKLTASGNLLIGALSTVSATGTLTLTATGSGSSITQSDAGSVTTLFAPTMVLSAGTGSGATIGSSGSSTLTVASSLAAQLVTLTTTAGGAVNIAANDGTPPVSVSFAGASSASQLSLTASGGISIASGAKITGASGISLQAATSITQSAAGVTLISPVISLTATTGNIGTSTAIPMGLNSGSTSNPVALTAVGGGNVFLAGMTNGTFPGAVALTGGNTAGPSNTFYLSAAGSISIASSATLTAGTATLNATGAGSSISQADPTGTTTIFASTVNLTSGTGSTANIGSNGIYLGIAQTAQDQSQAVTLTANAGASVYIDATNGSHPLDSVLVNLAGSSTAGTGATAFSINAAGGIAIASGAKVTDTTGTITLSAGTGSNITQAASSTTPSLTATTVSLTADFGGTQGTIGSSTIPIAVSASTLSASAGSNVFLTDSVAARATLISTTGSVQFSDTSTVVFSGPSSAATTFTVSALGLSQAVAGSNVITSPTVTLTAGATGIGSSSNPLGISALGSTTSGISLTLNSTGAVYISGTGASTPDTGLSLGTSSVSSTLNINTQGFLTSAPIGFGGTAVTKATTFVLTATGSINPSVQNPTVSSAITLTANSGSDTDITSASPVNFAGPSSAGAAATVGFIVAATGNIVFNSGASITSTATTTGLGSVFLTATNGSITQMGTATPSSPAVSIFSPNISLTANNSSVTGTSTIGSSSTMPLILSSGIAATSVTLTALALSNTYISVPTVTISSNQVVGNVVVSGNNGVSGTAATSQFYLNAGGSISQSAASGTTSVFAHNVTLTSGGGIGSSTDPVTFAAATSGSSAQSVNLNFTANNGSVFLSALNSVTSPAVSTVLTGTSKVLGSGNSANLTATGSITQSAAGLGLVAPTIAITAAGNIGSSTTTPLGINSGNGINPASVTLNSTAGSIFLAGVTNLTTPGSLTFNSLNSSAGTFYVSAAGSISIGTGATLNSVGTLTLNATGVGSSITQVDPTGTTTIFAPTVVLSSGTGSAAYIGSTNAIGIAQVSSDQSSQTVALTANAGSSVNIDALSSPHSATDVVSVNLVGASSAGTGNTSFSLTATGGIQISNTAGGKVTDTTGTISLSAGAGSSITQAAASTTPVLTAATVNLLADASGTSGVIGTPGTTFSALNVSASTLTATAGNNIFLSNSVALANFSATSQAGNVQLNDSLGVSFSGNSSANGSYTLNANGQVVFQQGAALNASSITMSSGAGGGFAEVGTGPVLSASSVTLTAGALGIGNSTAHPLAMFSQANDNVVSLSVLQSTGAVYISAINPDSSNNQAGLNVTATTTGSFNLVNVSGDIEPGSTIKSSGAITIFTNPGGTSTGQITATVGNLASNSTPVTLTALGSGTVNLIALGPVNLAGQSGSSSSSFTLQSGTLASGTINFNTGATVSTSSGSGKFVTLQTSNKGSITQTTSGTSIFSPTINLLPDISTGSTSTIGSATIPIGINSGTSTPVLLNATSANGTFISGNVVPATTGSGSITLTGINSVGSATGLFVLTSNGNILLATGAQVIALGTISLTSTASGGTITQTDSTNTTTLFAPTILLTAGAGTGATVGTPTDALTVAANTSASNQTVNLTLKAGDSVYVSTGGTTVNANLIGTSTVANTFSLQSSGAISLASAAQVKATANTGSINLNAIGNISQSSAGLTLIAPNILLTSSGSVGTSATTAIGVNGDSSAGVLLTVSADTNVFVAGTMNGATAGNVSLGNASSAAGGTFSLSAAGSILITTGATITGLSANSSVVLTATGTNSSISQQDLTNTTTIFAPTVILTSGTGIGSSTNEIGVAQTASSVSPQNVSLTVNAGSSAFIDTVSSANTSNLVNANMVGSSSAGSGATFSLTASGNIQLTNTTQVINKITASTGTINLTAGVAGQITATGTALNAPKVNLIADQNGTTGTITAGIASGTTVTVHGGSTATLTGAGSLTLGNSANATSITVQTAGTILTTGTQSSPTITLQSTASGAITLGSAITATSALTLQTNGAVNQGAGGLATAGQINFIPSSGLSTSGAFGTTTAPILTSTPILALTTTGAVYDSNTGNLTISNSYSGTSFNVTTSGNLQTFNAANAVNITASTVTLAATGTNSTLTLGGNVGQTGASVTVRGDAGISQSATTLRITGTNVTLQTATGGAGVTGTPLQTNATNLFIASTNAASSFFVNNQSAVSIGTPTGFANNSPGSLTLTAGGNITVSSVLPVANASLTTGGTNSSITAMAVLGNGSANSVISLNPFGTGSVSTSGTGKFEATTLDLTAGAGNGNLGSAATPIATQAGTIVATTGGTGTTAGTIGINNTGAVTVTLQSGGNASVVSTGAVTVAGTNSVGNNNGQFSITTSGTGAGISLSSGAQISTLGSISLTTNGASSTITQSGTATTLTAPQITLKSASDIGSNAQALLITGLSSLAETLGLTANSAGNTFISASNTNTSGTIQVQMLGTSSAAGTIGFTLSSTSSTTGGGINLQTGATITASNTAGTIALSTSGNITQSSGTATTLLAPNVNLSGGTIGNPSLSTGNTIVFANLPGKTTPVNLQVGTTNTTSGIALLSTPSSVEFTPGTTSSTGTLSLSATGSIIVGAGTIVSAGNTSPTALQLSAGAAGSITQLDNTAVLEAPSISLTAGGSIGSSTTNLLISGSTVVGSLSAVSLTAKATGNVYITDSATGTPGVVNLAGSSSAGGTGGFNLTSAGTMTIGSTATVTGTTSISLAATGANSSIAQVGTTSASLFSPNINLTADQTGGTGGIGTIANSILINNLSSSPAAVNLTANTTGNVFIINTKGAVNLGASSANPTATTAGNGLNVGGIGIVDVGQLNSGVVALVASGTGNISTGNNISIGGTTLFLGTISGNIGTSASPVTTTATSLTVNAGGLGTVFVNSTNASGLTLANASSSGTSFSLTSAGPLTVSGTITTNAITSSTSGNLTLKDTSGALNINGNLSVNGGSMIIQDTDTANGSITFGTGVQVTTNVSGAAPNGSVTIVVGSTIPTTGSPFAVAPQNTTLLNTSPGQVLVGTGSNSTPVLGPASGSATVNAKGRNVIFSSTSANAIILNDQVLIKADPPAPVTLSQPSLTAATTSPAAQAGSTAYAAGAASPAGVRSGVPMPAMQTVQTPATFPVITDTVRRNSGSVDFGTQVINQQINPAFDGTDVGSGEILLFDNSGLRSAQTSAKPTARFSNQSDLQPVSSFSGVSQSALQAVETSVGNKVAPNPFCLRQGGVLFAPAHQLTVKTPTCNINVGANAVVLVVATRDGVSIYNLHDAHIGDVSISTQGRKYPVGLSQHIMLSHSKSGYEAVNPVNCIAHADMEATDLPGGMKLFRSNFSMASAVAGLEPVAALKNSPNPQDRKLAARLIKDAAIMSMTISSHKSFRRYAPLPSISQLP